MILTTIEQSNKLIEAGLKEESADMWYHPDWSDHPDCSRRCRVENIPAWSLSALWELMRKANVAYEFSTLESAEEVMHSLIEAVTRLAKQNRI